MFTGISMTFMLNNLNGIMMKQARLTKQLSSGQRIVSAADDAAGLAISERMRGQIRGLRQAQRNVQDGISLIQTAEGGMVETQDMLHRMRELAVQASNGTLDPKDRELINEEFQELKEAINDISGGTQFNNKDLLDGSQETEGIYIQAGANAGQGMRIKIGNLSSAAMDLDGLDILTQDNAEIAMEKLKEANSYVSKQRATLGAQTNRLEHTLSNLQNQEENLQAAESRIRDLDMAKAIVEYTKNALLMQACQAMIAQSMKMEREYVLGLLKGLDN